jgi:zinc protease
LAFGTACHRNHFSLDDRVTYNPPKAETWQLANGLTIMFLRDPELPIVSGTLYVRGGSIWEPETPVGSLDALGDLMRQGGTVSTPPDALDRALEDRAAAISSTFGDEFGVFAFECLKSDLSVVSTHFADVVRRPRFDSERISLWRGIALEGIRRRTDDPGTMAGIAFSQALFGNTPYNRIPSAADIRAISSTILKRLHAEFVRPDYGYFVLSGDLERSEAEQLASKLFGDWIPRGTPLPPLPPVEYQEKPAIYFISGPFEQSSVVFGHRGVPRLTSDYLAIDGFNKIFGNNGFSARLMQRIRTKLGLVYSIGGEISVGAMEGRNSVYLQTKAVSTANAIEESLMVLDSMKTGPIEEQEMQAMKDTSLNSFIFKFDTIQKLASRYALLKILAYPEDYDQRYIPGMTGLTQSDIIAVANKRWNKDRFSYIVVGNETAFQSLAGAVQNSASPLFGVRLIRAGFSDRMVVP